MARTLKETIVWMKNRREVLRKEAAELQRRAKECSDTALGLTEAIDALEPWERAVDVPADSLKPSHLASLPGNPDPEGVGQHRG